MKQAEATQRFYELVWPHRATLLRVARIQTGNAAEADDLAQETLLKAFKSIGAVRDGSNTKAWLMTILRNTRLDRLRTMAGSIHPVSLDELEIEPASLDAGGDRSDDWQNPQAILTSFSDQEVIDALVGIPEELRWTLLLVDVEGLDHADAAAILDVPTGTVKSRTHRGRAALRAALLPLARDRRLTS